MSRSSSAMFDRQITIFSPEGRLFQSEYVMRAVESSNITVIAIKGDDCAVIVAQKKVNSHALAQDKLLDPSSLSCMHYVTKEIGGAFVGTPGDCRSVVYSAREKSFKFAYENGFEIPVHYLSHKMANMNQVYTQHAYMRLLACVGIIIGIDRDTKLPQIYRFDPTGWVTGNKAAVCSPNETEAISILERMFAERAPKTRDQTFITAISALQEVLGMDLQANDIEVCYVTVDNPTFQRMDATEIDEVITKVAERDIYYDQ